MVEMINMRPIFPGNSESDELKRIFKVMGTPSIEKWPGLADLQGWKVYFSFLTKSLNNLRFIKPKV